MTGRLPSLAGSDGVGGAVLDEASKREIRLAVLAAVAVPGYQVPFGSREMPVARGWGSGGLQISAAIIGPADVIKVIDQGDDAGVNAANLRALLSTASGCAETTATAEATVIQTRHRIPEHPLRGDQILVYQVPVPEPLRGVERDDRELRRLHAEAEYAPIWVSLYEDIVRNGVVTHATGYPVLVNGRYVMATSPIPRWDVPKLDRSDFLSLFGAGREKRIYAVPPHTDVAPITFEDVPFEVERVAGCCAHCGAEGGTEAYLVEVPGGGNGRWVCSDSDWCLTRRGA